ncbi:hypothetical protein L207DRAFT_561974 [Hyaloscypha variabilis F]|uniref:Rhodopsin domain-containing protein n=1 Tax=Hyaloscypha variabilis (strain UAMH 11265 / GT02V1 / F) TaxID=1149755 RepID=A0A2J6S7F4_HYAVF|nr:hypothetical protein L207DRAFT_561974 [Hyaloscypha variabilis F]
MADAQGPVYRGQQITLSTVAAIMTFFGVVAMCLRIAGRYLVVRKLGADDWLMLAGTIMTCIYLFEILYGIKFGSGLHGVDLTPPDMVGILKLVYVIQLTYNTCTALIKSSIVAFYLRLGSIDSTLRRVCYGTFAFIAVLWIVSQSVAILQCLPINANWDIFTVTHKKCINTLVYFYINAGVNILLDMWILVMPIKTLTQIKRPKRDKIILMAIFGVGGLSCLAGIIRLYTIRIYTQSKDPFYDGSPINMWSMVEVNIAIVCASVPAMKPLFHKTIRERMTTGRSNGRSHLGGSQFGHQMIPLSGDDISKPGTARQKNATYSVGATGGEFSSSEENMVKKGSLAGGIEYQRDFTVEESYIHSSKVLREGSAV